MDVLILAGGKGTRLTPLTKDKPKPLVEINNLPIMDYIMKYVSKSKKIDRIIMYVPEKYLGDFAERYGKIFGGKSIVYVTKELPNNAKALQYALTFINGNAFLLLMGDIIFDVNLDLIISYYEMHGGEYNISTVKGYKIDKQVCEIKGNYISKINDRLIFDDNIACGIYVLNKMDINNRMGDYFDDVFDKLAKEHKMMAFKYFGYIKQVNTLDELKEIESDLNNEYRYIMDMMYANL